MAYVKTTNPLKVGSDYMYLPTTTDQVTDESSGKKLDVLLSQIINHSGRNLAQGTIDGNPTPWEHFGWSGNLTTVSGRTYKLVAEHGWHTVMQKLPDEYIGKQLTISFYAKKIGAETTSTQRNDIGLALNGNSQFPDTKITDIPGDLPTADTWFYVRQTFTLQSPGKIGIGLHCEPESSGLKTTWYFKDLKIEEGFIATPYTAAPEDE